MKKNEYKGMVPDYWIGFCIVLLMILGVLALSCWDESQGHIGNPYSEYDR